MQPPQGTGVLIPMALIAAVCAVSYVALMHEDNWDAKQYWKAYHKAVADQDWDQAVDMLDGVADAPGTPESERQRALALRSLHTSYRYKYHRNK